MLQGQGIMYQTSALQPLQQDQLRRGYVPILHPRAPISLQGSSEEHQCGYVWPLRFGEVSTPSSELHVRVNNKPETRRGQGHLRSDPRKSSCRGKAD